MGLPGGTIDPPEEPLRAMQRELQEETGIEVPAEKFKFFKTLHVRFPRADFRMHMFSHELDNTPTVILDPREHKAYEWIKPAEAERLNLIRHCAETIRSFYNL